MVLKTFSKHLTFAGILLNKYEQISKLNLLALSLSHLVWQDEALASLWILIEYGVLIARLRAAASWEQY